MYVSVFLLASFSLVRFEFANQTASIKAAELFERFFSLTKRMLRLHWYARGEKKHTAIE